MKYGQKPMPSPRLEAFSDGVFAIIITIMVLELHAPEGGALADLYPLVPVIFSYILSFVYVIIYWNNHHHLLKAMMRPSAGVMWANAHLLFWLSLIPFATAWLGESHGETVPAILYGVVLLAAAIAYFILQIRIVAAHGANSALARALGKDLKGKLSPVLYIVAILAAFVAPTLAYIIYAAVALMWIIPDRRIEKVFDEFRE